LGVYSETSDPFDDPLTMVWYHADLGRWGTCRELRNLQGRSMLRPYEGESTKDSKYRRTTFHGKGKDCDKAGRLFLILATSVADE
jgi:hypothetical protein